MRYILPHLKAIVQAYKGDLPLAHFLKGYFKQHPILGSRDRKTLSAMAYTWYRSAKGIADNDDLNTLLMQWMQENTLLSAPLPELLQPLSFNIESVFPFDIPLSEGITRQQWLQSMLVQPDLFIRIRKDKGKIISLLNAQQIPFTFITDNCLSLPNGAKIDAILPEDCYVVQDASSQHTGTWFQPKKNEQWYDCCSGAGGKSLLLKDLEPGVRLTVSDRRESILHNLTQRFRLYRHVLPVAHIADVADEASLNKALGTKQFDHIICDAPCSGSGTWARTPEQLYFFNPESIATFSALQKKIAINAAAYLKPGGRLIYITCSVFTQENEEVTNEVVKHTGLQLTHAQIINGTAIKADNMYIAILQKTQ